MKKLILIFILMFSVMDNVQAEGCSKEILTKLKQQAENIVIDTEFDDRYTYLQEYETSIITIQGLTQGFYLYSEDKEYLFDYRDSDNGLINTFITSDVKYLYIYNEICPNDVLKKVKLSLKTYNPFADYEECKGISGDELDVCDKFYDKALTETEFERRIKEYNESLKKPINKIKKDKNLKYYIIAGAAILVIVGIILIIKRRKNNKLD